MGELNNRIKPTFLSTLGSQYLGRGTLFRVDVFNQRHLTIILCPNHEEALSIKLSYKTTFLQDSGNVEC